MAAQTEVLRSRQQKIEHALQMIALGEYGFCEHCGEQIPPERLEVLPEATQCTNCQ